MKNWAFLLALMGIFSAENVYADDVEYGEYLSSECVTCHQAGATSSEQIPSIEGWDKASFVAVMKSIRAKEQESKVMQTIAASLDDEQIDALAAYFATLKSNE
ncbi:MAG: c-type cytochrome [Hyphomicrobiales bacterium]